MLTARKLFRYLPISFDRKIDWEIKLIDRQFFEKIKELKETKDLECSPAHRRRSLF